jgi:GNAT superfamily N-acetyltransferase
MRPNFATLPAGTRLFHGTDARSSFKMLAGPAWLTESIDTAQLWVGWKEAGGGGKRRILEYETTRDLKLVNVTARSQWQNLGDLLMDDPEPCIWTLADRVKEEGYDGWWIRDSEIMVSHPKNVLKIVGTWGADDLSIGRNPKDAEMEMAVTLDTELKATFGSNQIYWFGPFVIIGDGRGGILGKIEVSFWPAAEWVIDGVKHSHGPRLHLAFIGVEKEQRGKGNATKILSALAQIADKYGWEMDGDIDPQPDEKGQKPPMNRRQLLKFYRKFGFELQPDTVGVIVRRPKSPNTSLGAGEETYALRHVIDHLKKTDTTGDPEWVKHIVGMASPYPVWELHYLDPSEVDDYCSDRETAEEYAEVIDELPPAVAVPSSGSDRLELVDGGHRFYAAALAEVTFPCYIPAGTRRG